MLFLSPFLLNFFLGQDRGHGDVPPHLVQPCSVALYVTKEYSSMLCFFLLRPTVIKSLHKSKSVINGVFNIIFGKPASWLMTMAER